MNIKISCAIQAQQKRAIYRTVSSRVDAPATPAEGYNLIRQGRSSSRAVNPKNVCLSSVVYV